MQAHFSPKVLGLKEVMDEKKLKWVGITFAYVLMKMFFQEGFNDNQVSVGGEPDLKYIADFLSSKALTVHAALT